MGTYNMDYTTRDNMIYLIIPPIVSSLLSLPFCLSIPSVDYPISSVWTTVTHFLYTYVGPFDWFFFLLSLSLLLSLSSIPLYLLLFSNGIYYSHLCLTSLLLFPCSLLLCTSTSLLSFSIHLLYVSLWGLWKLW